MDNTTKTNWKKLTRKERGEIIFNSKRIFQTPRGWRVQSQSKGGTYLIKIKKNTPFCNCPDCQINKVKCKHIFALEFYLKKKIFKNGKISIKKKIKITYSQNWKAYDKSQINEKLEFMRLAKDLSNYIENEKNINGRPKILFQDLIFCNLMKTYTTFSFRRFMSDIKIAKEKNLINKVPSFSTIAHFLQKKELTLILKNLVIISSLPLKNIDTIVTADSSGFSTSRFGRWYDYKYGKEKKYRMWLKAHLMSGVKTNIITAVEITKGKENDCPQLNSLVTQTAKNFKISEVSCDRAYISHKNLQLITDVGAVAYIPFKSNTSGKQRGCAIWKKMYHYFLYKHDEFLQHYHQRSNSETVFHMIKSKFGGNLRSKDKTSQINELLCKIICHNICVVIQEINELGINGEFIKK